MSRTVRWQVLLIGAGLALVATLLTYLALTYRTEQIPTVGGTYTEGVAGEPHAINPLLAAYNEVDQDLCALIFAGLTRFDSSGRVVPDLAQGWEISLDGLIYVFHLRSGVRWHDGEPFTADDVLFTVQLLQDPDYPGPADIGALWRTVQVEKVDNYTLRFLLAEPYAPFLDYTTIGILPQHVLSGTRAADLPTLDFNLAPVGVGPFRIAEVVAERGQISSVLLDRNPAYYGPGPLIEHLRLRFYLSNQSAFRAYLAGEVDGVAQIALEDIDRAYEETGETLQLYSAQMARYSLIFLNLGRPEDLPFFQEKEVRQALLYGLDREGIVENILHGQAVVAHSPIVAGTWAYDPDIRRYNYHPEQARAMLDRAGWRMPPAAFARNKGGIPFTFDLLTSNDPLQVALAEEIARQWGELGIGVTVVAASPLEVYDALDQRNYEAALVNLALPGDPDPYPLWHQTQITIGQNYAGFDHREMSEVIETARITLDMNQRAMLYRRFQEIFADEVPALLLYHPVYTYGVDRKVNGVQIGPLMTPADRFATVNLWYVATRRVIVSQSQGP